MDQNISAKTLEFRAKAERLILALVAGALAACTTPVSPKNNALHQPQHVREADEFTFSIRSPLSVHDADEPAAETARLKELEERLTAEHRCPKGYAITSRRVIVQIGESDEMKYEGRCDT